jgi:TIR domain-containing protein
MRDHLFVSYAWEDGALAEWLVRKLTALGYRVWCDRFKVLGGDRWPRDIDGAIKQRTFRMLALLSRHSLEKANPAKERMLGLALGRDRGESFLIPLNVDGLAPTDLGWELSDLNYIAFENWAAGLDALLTTLEKTDAPRPLIREGPAIAAETFFAQAATLDPRHCIFAYPWDAHVSSVARQ